MLLFERKSKLFFTYVPHLSVLEFMYGRRFVSSECDIYVPDNRANLSRYEYAITSLYCFLCSYLCIYIYSDCDVLPPLSYFTYLNAGAELGSNQFLFKYLYINFLHTSQFKINAEMTCFNSLFRSF